MKSGWATNLEVLPPGKGFKSRRRLIKSFGMPLTRDRVGASRVITKDLSKVERLDLYCFANVWLTP
eukprot:498842-Pleurochrysis_carterae.AAC.3